MKLKIKINYIIEKIKNNYYQNNKKNKTHVKLSKVFSKNELRQKVFLALEDSGIIFLDSEKQSNQDIQIKDYLFDSLQMMLFLVALEQKIGYELADNIYIQKTLVSVDTIVDTLFESELKKIQEK